MWACNNLKTAELLRIVSSCLTELVFVYFMLLEEMAVTIMDEKW